MVLIISADIYSEFDYAALWHRRQPLKKRTQRPISSWCRRHRASLVVSLRSPACRGRHDEVHSGAPRLTLANIGVLATVGLSGGRAAPFLLLPHYQQWAAADEVTGELFTGRWRNVTSIGLM